MVFYSGLAIAEILCLNLSGQIKWGVLYVVGHRPEKVLGQIYYKEVKWWTYKIGADNIYVAITAQVNCIG